MPEPTVDPRVLKLAAVRDRDGYGALIEGSWDNLDPALRDYLKAFIDEAGAWLRAAVEAGIAPAAERPSDNDDAVYVDDQGFLYGEYRSAPATADTHLLRLVWADEMAQSKADLEQQGAVLRHIGWSR